MLATERLLVRPWRDDDRAAFAAINADPEVRRFYYPAMLTRAGSDEIIDSCVAHLAARGFAFLAVERRADGALVGGAGLSMTESDMPFPPAVEIGWILGRAYWRQGYATEISRAWFGWAAARGIVEVIGYTSVINTPSRLLMERLGMTRNPTDDFDDPTVPVGDPLRPHVLYRLATG